MTKELKRPVPAPVWSPILEGEEALWATAAIDAVAGAIGGSPCASRYAASDLCSGESGIALLFEYLDRARPGAGYGEIACGRLGRAIDGLGAHRQIPGLYMGFTGVAWAVEHLQDGPDGEDDEEDPNEEVDAVLLNLLRQAPWPYDYDLTSGLVGFGVYALERLPRPAAVTCLERVVDRLAEIASQRPEGLGWPTPPHLVPAVNRDSFPRGYENLGLAHGSPGIIAVLARICAAGIALERARPLLAGAVEWLLAQKLPAGQRSVFPLTLEPEVAPRASRAAWCYGDPGIALALFAAGRAAGEPRWEAEALALARAIARRPVERCGVEDAGLCHGSLGLAHLLNRLYQATGDPELLAAARAWFGRSSGYWRPGQGIGGFLAWTPPEGVVDRLEWNADPSFLTGSSGMALALLAATSGIEPAWDRVMLVSPLPARNAAWKSP
jgi:lantibiotic biosynthesis protein